jgi:hypothetical protein
VNGVTGLRNLRDKELRNIFFSLNITMMNKSMGMRVGLFSTHEDYKIVDENSEGMRLFGTFRCT